MPSVSSRGTGLGRVVSGIDTLGPEFVLAARNAWNFARSHRVPITVKPYIFWVLSDVPEV